ncbi:ATP-dependent nuclease [Dongia sedimenti]|uniref:AAA family ATPase n=1 Tax=Dongia sedimenti TaxID=3064282 RepID=A0ABU0YH06_9PROT|nr:AAA family ATPase [Rhodospirillaceae bacterium R-7]
MRIVSFSVQNYRSIVQARKLNISDNLTVLIGQNNEGKSNFLSAIGLVLAILDNLSVASLDDVRRYFQRQQLRRNPARRRIGTTRSLEYEWLRDFPVSLQEAKPKGLSVFTVEFRLTEAETAHFKEEIGHNLNGLLPVQISLGREELKFAIAKQGRGQGPLSQKAREIAAFIGKLFESTYIPAIRPAGLTYEIVEEMVARELSSLQKKEEDRFKKAVEQIEKLQQGVVSALAANIQRTIAQFIPSVREIEIRFDEENISRAIRRSCEIFVDDGVRTSLQEKGDGIKSLIALAMMRHSRNGEQQTESNMLAIEEPESHLHPGAIHEIRRVLLEISQRSQVIITTHCPILVNRDAINSNIVVAKNKATQAKNIAEIRQILGVQTADNLSNTEVMLVVEGEDDRASILHILSLMPAIAPMLQNGRLNAESMGGCSNLRYRLGQLDNTICRHHVLLDDDAAGREAVKKATEAKLLQIRDVTMTVTPDLKESEFEDLVDPRLYAEVIRRQYGVDLGADAFRKSRSKWSSRMEAVFKSQGKPFPDALLTEIKYAVSAAICESKTGFFLAHRRQPIDALAEALVEKLSPEKAKDAVKRN